MRTASITFLKPVVIVDITNMTNRYVSGTFSGIAGTDKKYLKSFVADFPGIDLLEQPFPLKGRFSFSILDIDLDVTSDLNSNPVVDDTVNVLYGDQTLTAGNFVTLQSTQIFENPVLESDLQTYSFVSSDVRRLLKGNIGRRKIGTILDAVITPASTIISCDDVSNFVDPANLPTHFDNDTGSSGANDAAYIQINSEIIAYRTLDVAGDDFEALTRNCVGIITDGTFAGHPDDATVTQVYCFRNLYPTEALLQILLTTDDGSGDAFYDMATFDSGYEGMGFEANLSSTEIDIEGIERVGWKYFNNAFENCGQLLLNKEVDGVKWIVENILKPGGLYMFIEPTTGKISVKSIDRLDLIEDFSADDNLVKDDIEKINSYKIDVKNTLNKLSYQWVINPVTGNVFDNFIWNLDDSVTEYSAREKPYVVKSPLWTSLSAEAGKHVGSGTTATEATHVLNTVGRRWFYTFGNPLGILNFDVKPDKWVLEPGDFITITHDNIPDISDGTRGWTSKKFFITKQRISPLTNPPVFNIEAVTLEAYTKLSSFYSFTTIAEGSIDDTSVAFDSDNTITTQTADGFVDPGGFISPDLVIFRIKITPPGSGSTQHWIKLGFKGIDTSVPVIRHDQNYRAIRYLSSNSTAFNLDFVIAGTANGTASVGFPITDRFKVDWYEASASGGGGERPTVDFIQFKYTTFGEAMSFDKRLRN